MSELNTRVVRISGIPEEMLKQLDARVGKRRNGSRSQYVRDLIKLDLLAKPTGANDVIPMLPDAMALFNRIESRDTSLIKPLASGANSREAIYGDCGVATIA